jgi:hypothetical protein
MAANNRRILPPIACVVGVVGVVVVVLALGMARIGGAELAMKSEEGKRSRAVSSTTMSKTRRRDLRESMKAEDQEEVTSSTRESMNTVPMGSQLEQDNVEGRSVSSGPDATTTMQSLEPHHANVVDWPHMRESLHYVPSSPDPIQNR